MVPLGTTNPILIQRYPLVLHNLIRYGGTRRYYKTYVSSSYLILVLHSISLSYGTYTCFT